MTSASRPRLFCSNAARLRGDDNTATVARIDAWILVEFPGTWGRDPIRDAAIPVDVRNSLLAALKEIPRSRLLFIRRRLEGEKRCRVYVARSAEDAGYAFADLPSLREIVGFSFTSLLEHPDRDAPPLVLVCTHGQHDSCCGRRGYPLYDALRNRAGIETWQCSHVGGDRFAANAVVLPWGVFYGPVEPEQAETLVRTILDEEIFLPAYRGRSTMSRPAQAAETFVRRAGAIVLRDALQVTGRENLSDGRVLIQLREVSGRIHSVTVERFVSTESAFATCGSTASDSIEQFRLVRHERS